MTIRRYQLVAREGRLRLVRTAVAMLVEQLPGELRRDRVTPLDALSRTLSGRLYEVGLTNAQPVYLLTIAESLDAIDGLTTGRYDVERFVTVRHHGQETRDALIRGYEADVDYCEGLAVLPIISR